MFKLSCGAAAVFLLLQTPVASLASEVAGPQAMAERIDAIIAPLYKADAPGATIIVVKDGKTVFRKAYGMADLARQITLTPETTMRIGSITKQFTAAAILLLADEGKLALTDDITKYLPDYPAQGKKITIEHLLTHTSGVASYTSKPDYIANMAKDLTVAELIDSFKNDTLDFEPGSNWRYSNSGYVLLGAVIEKVSGMPYARFVEQRIFIPLGMTNTAYEGYERAPNPHALGYEPGKNGFVPAPRLSMTQPYSSGSLVSTVDDLARWDAAVSEGRLLKASTWQRAFTPYRQTNGKTADYGYGWELETLRGVQKVAHSGSVIGFLGYVMRLPSEHVYVAVLSNSRGGLVKPDLPADKAAAIVIGKPFPEFKATKIDPALLDQYAGVYKSGTGASKTLRRVGDALAMQRAGGQRIPLTPYSESGFFTPGTLQWYEFKREANGTVKLVTHVDDKELVDERMGPVVERPTVKIAAAVFDARVGRYEFAGGFALTLAREGNRYFAQGTGQPKLEIFPASETVFFATAVDAELRFDNPSDPAQLILAQGKNSTTGKKIE
jgi:CubicO group peptidase (beta-lactamase class C family)